MSSRAADMKNVISLRHILCALLVAFPLSSHAAQPLQNGNFETGDLNGWRNESEANGVAEVVAKGACFSANDTRAMDIRGQYAALLRSNSDGDKKSVGVITSDAFNAGDGIAFIAATESTAAIKPNKEPARFEVRILDGETDQVLVSQILSPKLSVLKSGCPGESSKGLFSSHYFSTKAFAEEQRGIKLQFRQSTHVKGSSFFTLIDQIVVFNEGEAPIFHSRPVAVAGIQSTSSGTPMLDSTGSFDPDQRLYDLNYSWYIDDLKVRRSRRPCVGDLSQGEHRAVLYVSDGLHAISDNLRFSVTDYVPPNISGSTPSANATSTTSSSPTLAPLTSTPTSNSQVTGATGNTATSNTTTNTTTNSTDGRVVSDSECSTGIDLDDAANDPYVVPTDPNDIYSNDTPFDDEELESDIGNSATATSTPRVIGSSSTISNSGNLSSTSILWKPTSEGDGNLVILTPNTTSETNVRILSAQGNVIEAGRYVGRTNGDRPTYRFNRPGSAYPSPSILQVGSTRYLVSNPGSRVN